MVLGIGLVQVARAWRGVGSGYQPDFAQVPMKIGSYQGRALSRDESLYKYLKANAMDERVYQSGKRTARLTMIYGADWRTIHAPTGCYPAQGWDIWQNRTIRIDAPPDCPHPGPLEARVLEAVKDETRELAVYMYARPGATTSDWTEQGLKVAMGRNGAGGMIITLRSSVTNQDVAGTERDLVALLSAIYPRAVSFWYQKPGT